MDLIHHIETLVNEIETKPNSIDLDVIRHALIEARELAVEGLKRSKDATSYAELNPKHIKLLDDHSNLKDSFKSLSTQVELSKSSLSLFNDLFSDLKNKALGKAELVYLDSPLYLSQVKSQILSMKPTDIKSFLSLQASILKDFRKEFMKTPSTSLSNRGTRVDVNKVKIGG